MRQTYKINDDWIFIKENVGMEAAMTAVRGHISFPTHMERRGWTGWRK